MKIVVISDNHGRLDPIHRILDAHPEADLFIHCGDSELPRYMLDGYICVRGNNDFLDYQEYVITDIGRESALIIHGTRLAYYHDQSLLVNRAKRAGCRYVFYGHTHIFDFHEENGVYLINPGSISHNRDGSPPCYAIVTIEDGNIEVERVEYVNS